MQDCRILLHLHHQQSTVTTLVNHNIHMPILSTASGSITHSLPYKGEEMLQVTGCFLRTPKAQLYSFSLTPDFPPIYIPT